MANKQSEHIVMVFEMRMFDETIYTNSFLRSDYRKKRKNYELFLDIYLLERNV